MITVAVFGEEWGKLGNQLFLVSLLFAVDHRLGYGFYLPRNGESLWDCFDLDVPDRGPLCPHLYQEPYGSCNYDPLVFEQPDATRYRGYFQSYRYFEDCREALATFLRFEARHRALAEATLFAWRRRYRRPLVSVHVRRGDYVKAGFEEVWGNLVADGYYERAVEAIGDDVTYMVFSDDLEWCRQHLPVERALLADFDHFTTLCLMTGCDINVVPNSSFSWCGAFLNPLSEAYATSRCCGPKMAPPNDRQDDIVPPSWHTIPVFDDHPADHGTVAR